MFAECTIQYDTKKWGDIRVFVEKQILVFDSDYALILCPHFKLNTLWNIFMILSREYRTGQADVSNTKMKTLAFLLLELSPFVLFLRLISCPPCNSNTLWKILMVHVFGRNVEEDKTTCHVQK